MKRYFVMLILSNGRATESFIFAKSKDDARKIAITDAKNTYKNIVIGGGLVVPENDFSILKTA